MPDPAAWLLQVHDEVGLDVEQLEKRKEKALPGCEVGPVSPD